jgi:hypothetical protein
MFSVNGIAFLCPCLIFIYGLFYGTLYNPIKEWKKTLIQFSLFIVLGIVISLFNLNFGSLCAGGLVTLIYFKIKDYKKNIRR